MPATSSRSLDRVASIGRTFVCGALLLAFSAREITASSPAAGHGAHYAHLFGETYRTKVELWLFAAHDDFETLYLGRHDGAGGTALSELPREASPKDVGRRCGDFVLLALVPAGSHVILTAETHEVTERSGIREQGGYPMGLLATIVDGTTRRVGVRCEFIQTASKAPPRTPNQRINPAIAAPVSAVPVETKQ